MQKLTTKYSEIQGAYWMGLAVILGFASPYLLAQGFTNGEIGVLIAISGLLTAFLQPAAASLADDPNHPSPWMITIILSAGICCCSVLLMVGHRQWLLGFVFFLAIALLQTIQPLLNSLGVSEQINFGLARGIGSICFAVMSYILGKGIEHLGSIAVPVAMLLSFGFYLVFTLRYPLHHPETAQAKTQSKASPLVFIRKYPRFCITLSGTIFTYISHVLLSNFTYQIVQSKGGEGPEMGNIIALAALLELPAMFLFEKMRRLAGYDVWLRISGVFFLLRATGTFLCPSVNTLYMVQIFQMLGWALIAVNSIYYTNSIMEPEDAVKGQAYFTLAYTIASIVGSIVGGMVLDSIGASAMLLIGAVCAAVGCIVILITAEKGRMDP